MATGQDWRNLYFGRIDFKPEEFDRAIYQRGARMIWQQSSFCSCVDPNSGQADYTCPACFGKGYLYFNPTEIRGVVSSMSGNKEQIPVGLLDIGTTMLTTASKDQLGFRDRLTFEDFLTTYSQILTYESSPNGVRLKYQAEEVLAVYVLNTIIPPTSYTISSDKNYIIFNAGVLTNNERFSILCRIKPVYVVIDVPHELRGTFVKFGNPTEEWINLPKQYMIKREDLLPLQRGQLS